MENANLRSESLKECKSETGNGNETGNEKTSLTVKPHGLDLVSPLATAYSETPVINPNNRELSTEYIWAKRLSASSPEKQMGRSGLYPQRVFTGTYESFDRVYIDRLVN